MAVKCESSLEVAPFPHVSSGRDLRFFLSEETVQIRIDAGEILILNNHRLLHGRSVFDAPSGRHVRSVHVDLDQFHSRLRVLLLQAGNPDEWMQLGPGATA